MINRLRHYINCIRPLHWSKNILLFVPAIVAHELSVDNFSMILVHFFSFSLISSAGYCFNDYSDRDSDSKHIEKSSRPYASGEVTIYGVLALAGIMLIAGFSIAIIYMSPPSIVLLLVYITLNIAYTRVFKKIYLVDTICLSFFYHIRIVLGNEVLKEMAETSVSGWFIAFSVFAFLGLAFLKRLNGVSRNINQNAFEDRPYRGKHLRLLEGLTVIFGGLSIVIFSIYSFGPAQALFEYPGILLLVPFLLLSFYVLLYMYARKGEMNHDPLLFTLTNKKTASLIVTIATVYLFSY